MPKFQFKALDSKKNVIEGTKFGVSSKDIVSALTNEGLTVISITEVIDKSVGERKEKKNLFEKSSITYQDIAVFCRQLATLINAGVNILDGVEDLSEMVSSVKFRKILKKVAGDIREGNAFSDALKKHPKVFSRIFIAMITAGEKSGKLGKVLLDLSIYLENSVKLRRKIQAASVYPILVASFLFLTMVGLVLFIVPKFKSMFASFGAQLPLPTRIVVFISDLIIKNIFFIALALIIVIVAFIYIYKTKPGRMYIDNLKLKAPIFGEILKKIVFARFFQTLSTLLKSGVDIVSSLEISAKVMNNLPVEQIVDVIKGRILSGSSFAGELERFPVFPKMIVRMAAVGEKSGQLDEMLGKLSDYYTDEVDAAVSVMSSIIEPILIIMLGAIVGVVVVAMYLPIFKLAMAMMGQG